MKVFISWSGVLSRGLAEILKRWLPVINNHVKPYYSSEDIAKGSRWFTEISTELSDTKIGIICLTSDNLKSPWIMFEAGALAGNVERSKVCPICFNIDPIDIKGPLTNFQAVKFSKDDFKRLIVTINKELADVSLDISTLEKGFEVYWPKIEAEVLSVLQAPNVTRQKVEERSELELLQELLERTKELSFNKQDSQVLEKNLAQISGNQILDKIDSIHKELNLLKNHQLTRDELFDRQRIDAKENPIKSALFHRLVQHLKDDNKSYDDFLKDQFSLEKLFNSFGRDLGINYTEFLKHISNFDSKDIFYSIGYR